MDVLATSKSERGARFGGSIRIQSSIKHLGPCFGMNGHSRRDPDVISRLPDTTTQDLSVFIGFRCSNRVKIIILDENKIF